MDYLFSVLRKLLLVWYHLRFEALLLQLSILTFHLLNSKILKIPGVNLAMDHWQWCPSHSNKGTSNRKWQVMNISTCITEQPFRSKWDYISRNSQLNIELLRKRRVFLLTRKYGTHNSKMNSKITCSKAVQQQAEFISINYCSFRSWTSELQYWKEWPRWIF